MPRGMLKTNPVPRFWAKVDKQESGCWIWTAMLSSNGYGLFWLNNKFVRAHRFSFELANGPIPADKMVCHNCPNGDNKRCVNPDHLYLGDASVNALDGIAKGQMAVFYRKGMWSITENQKSEMVLRHQSGESFKSIAMAFNVTPWTVRWHISRRRLSAA